MPSLKALEEFRNSFLNIGNEVSILNKKNIPLEYLSLPDSEPVESSSNKANDLQTNVNANPNDSPEQEGDDSDSSWDFLGDEDDDLDFNFEGLLDAPVNDLPLPAVPDPDEELEAEGLEAENSPEDAAPEETKSDIEEIAPSEPDTDLGETLEEENSPEPESLPEEEAASVADENPAEPDSAKLNISVEDEPSLPEFDDDESIPEPDTAFEADDASLVDENNLEEESDAVLSDEEAPQEEFAEPEQENTESLDPAAEENKAADPDLPNDVLASEDVSIAPERFGIDEDVFTLSQDGFSLNSFEMFKENGKKVEEKDAYEDLMLVAKVSDKVEEIHLTGEELAKLQKTLDSYPLNVRIACEEVIAEQAVDPILMSKLVKSLVQGIPLKEMVNLLGKIQGRIITIPKGFEKKTGEALEARNATFVYIFVRRVLPVLRLLLMIAVVAVSLLYLIWRFIWIPISADLMYRDGYKQIAAGEYERANERFREALHVHRQKKWFYRYAEAFRDNRQYVDAEGMYDMFLWYYPRDKKGVLDYADMETYNLSNYAKADSLLRRNILDFQLDDKDALVAVGDNALLWGAVEYDRYEDARQIYARLLKQYGWLDPYVERMLKYFIRTDNLKEVLPLQLYFMNSTDRKIAASTLAELGGYLIDRKFEEVEGVPNEHISQIQGIRDVLIRAVRADPALPESHYHLARYYNYFGNVLEERITLERAIQTFDAAKQESVSRLHSRIDVHRRYSQLLINNREFFAAEEQLIKAIGLYENGVSRWLIARSPEFGQLYSDLGDIEYFTKDGNMDMALQYYLRAEENGWSPPEMQYRMGAAYYYQQQWSPALVRFVTASADMPLNRRLLNALGNVSYMRGNYAIAQGYYSRLLDILDTDRKRFRTLMPDDRPDHLELVERLMVARNNFGVTLEALTEHTGDPSYRSEALELYTESVRAWDSLRRNSSSLIRPEVTDISTPGRSLAYINAQQSFAPRPDYERQIYIQIDKDVLEPSPWEDLTPQSIRLPDLLF